MNTLDPQETPETDPPPVPRGLLIAFGLAALALAGALLFYAYGRFSDSPEATTLESISAFNPTTASGIASVQTDLDGLPDIGSPAPDFELATLAGETARLSDYLGRPVILNFWATWCAPCRVEMPELGRAQAEFDAAGDDGPIVLTINEAESAERVSEFFTEVGLTLPALLDTEGDVGIAYGAFFLPTTVIISPDGNVAAIHRGMISRDQLNSYLADIPPAEGS